MNAAHHGRALPGQVGERAPAHRHVEAVHVWIEAVLAEDAGEVRTAPPSAVGGEPDRRAARPPQARPAASASAAASGRFRDERDERTR
jgi:hypothetical protein